LFSLHQKLYSKRSLVFTVSLMLLFAVLVSGCGAEQAPNNAAGAQSKNTEEAAPETPQFKTVSTVNGDIEIPVHPKRIVAEEYLGSLIALDVIPVGSPGVTIENYYFKEALAGVSDTGVYGKPSAENIISLSPDLIITGNGDSYEQLSKIAPTVVIPYGELKNAHEELTYFGELLGKKDEAKAWLEEYDLRIATAKSKVDKAIPEGATFSIMEYSDKTNWVYGDNFGRGGQPIYQTLGRKPPVGIADEIMKKQWAEISSEMLPTYAGDYIIMTSNTRTLEEFQNDPIWGNLPAVKNGQIYIWPEDRSWYYDPIAVLAQSEELSEWLVSRGK
jgi:iron complex transport system substrate-binding protein